MTNNLNDQQFEFIFKMRHDLISECSASYPCKKKYGIFLKMDLRGVEDYYNIKIRA